MGSEPYVFFRLTRAEHTAIAGALRYWLELLEPSSADNRRGTGAPNDPFTAAPPFATTTPPATTARTVGPATEQPAPRDRWQHDAQGKEIPQPNAEAYTVRIWKWEQGAGKNGPFLDVRWEQKRAYCHDPKLFPWIVNAAKTRAQIVLYLKEGQNTTYQHIVGVKA